MPSVATSPPKKRGRKPNAAKWLSLHEVAEIVRRSPECLARLLDRAPGTFPGAIKGDDGWEVPERDLRAVMGAPTGPLPQWATVADVAHALCKSEKTIYWWLGLKMSDGQPLLPSRRVLGTIYILASDVLALPECMPESGRPSFFSEEVSSV